MAGRLINLYAFKQNGYGDKDYMNPAQYDKHQKIENRKAKEKHLFKLFQHYDTDHTGNLDKEQLAKMVEECNELALVGTNEFYIDQLVADYDEEGNNAISFEEFKRIKAEGIFSILECAFDIYDGDGDGFLNRIEFESMINDASMRTNGHIVAPGLINDIYQQICNKEKLISIKDLKRDVKHSKSTDSKLLKGGTGGIDAYLDVYIYKLI